MHEQYSAQKESKMSTEKYAKYLKSTFLWVLAGSIVVCILGTIFVRGCCVTFVDNYEAGYRYDLRSGKVDRIGRTGYILHAPFVVEIHTIDCRPMQVCINANSRVLNCKLVQFDPGGLELFISWHGRDDYVTGDSTNLHNILMSYAYDGSGKTYPFLKVIRELKSEEKAAAQ
jgi:hypothetical protein